jgi:hypothetical protein
MIMQTAANGTSWTTWDTLGGKLLDNPRLLMHNDGTLEVVGRGLDSMLWHRVRSGSTWSDWERIGSAGSSAIAA